MKMKKIALSCALLTAATLSNMSALAAAPGFFFGGQLGYTALNKGENVFVDFSGFSWGLNLGYNFSVNKQVLLGLEIDSSALGSFNDDLLLAPSFVGRATFIINENFNLFVKAGILREVVTSSNAYSDSDLTGTGSLGAAVPINKNSEISLEYRYIFGKSMENIYYSGSNSAISANNVLVGYTYYFSG